MPVCFCRPRPPLRRIRTSISDAPSISTPIRAIWPEHGILGTDLRGSPGRFKRPMPPQGLLDFMNALHKEGISVADINIMVKRNPAIALGLKP